MTSARASREPAKAVSVLVTSTRHVLPCSTVHVPAGGQPSPSVGTPGVTRARTGATSGRGWLTALPWTRQRETKRVTSGAIDVIVRVTRGEPTMVIRWTSRVSTWADCPGRARQLVGRR